MVPSYYNLFIINVLHGSGISLAERAQLGQRINRLHGNHPIEGLPTVFVRELEALAGRLGLRESPPRFPRSVIPARAVNPQSVGKLALPSAPRL